MGKRIPLSVRHAEPFQCAPLRALIAKDVDGLLMAGRCLSGDFIAHSSYRITGDVAAMGEAPALLPWARSKSLARRMQPAELRAPHESPAHPVWDRDGDRDCPRWRLAPSMPLGLVSAAA